MRLLGLLAVTATLVLLPANVSAQDNCHVFCFQCGQTNHYGGSYQEDWSYYPDYCTLNDCDTCLLEQVEVNEPSTQDLIEELEAVDDTDSLMRVALRHGDRLLVSPEREMVVIKGGCEGSAPVSIVILRPGVARQLGELGVPSLGDFLANLATT